MLQKIRLSLLYMWSRPHFFYAIIALTGGILFAIITPPFQGPDEEAHFFRSYQIARGHIILDSKGTRLGNCLPSEVHSSTIEASHSPSIRGYTSMKYDYRILNELLVDGVEKPDNCYFVDTTNTYSYTPIAYAPAVIGIGMVNIVNGPPLLAMYVARIFTVILTVLIFALAIKIMPVRKRVMVVILLTPMLLFQQAVISVDGLSYAVLVLFIAYTLYLYDKKSIRRSHWLKLLVTAVLLCLMKPLLYIFIPLVFILKSKGKIYPIVIVGVVVIVIAVSGLVKQGLYSNVEVDGAGDANQTRQIENLQEHPARALRVAWNTYMSSYGDGQTMGVIGVFGSADTKIPLWVYSLSVMNIAIALAVVSKGEKRLHLRKWSRRVFIGMLIIYFAGVNAAMYLSYTPINFDIVYGVQGRYFLPILILLPVVLTGYIYVSKKEEAKVLKTAAVIAVFTLLISLLIVFQRYYLYTA